jgi:ABC-type phosphate/phosphonate transport system ATPase subunit
MAVAPAVQRQAQGSPAAAGRPLLEVSGLSKRFAGGRLVLDGVDLVAREGEVTAILGPNGSGKSTLLRCIVRLVEPTSGTVHVAGQELTALSDRRLQEARRTIAMVFQSVNLVRASALGCSEVAVESSSFRTGAHRFYRSVGFEERRPAMRFRRPVRSA